MLRFGHNQNAAPLDVADKVPEKLPALVRPMEGTLDSAQAEEIVQETDVLQCLLNLCEGVFDTALEVSD